MRIALLCTILVFLCSGPAESMSQEISYPPEVIQRQQHVPESVIYGILLHQAVAFKDKADELDRSGGNGSAYRHHMEAKFGLTPQELNYLDQVAIEYRDKVRGPERDLKNSIARFQVLNGNLQRGWKVLPPPAEAENLLAKRDAMILQARKEFHTLVGDKEFARIDALVQYRVLSHLQNEHSPGSAKEWSAAARRSGEAWGRGVLGYTSIDFDPNAREVTAYSETDIYGYGIFYYEPIVSLKACGKVGSERAPAPGRNEASVILQCQGNTSQAYLAFGSHSAEIDSEDLGLKDDDYYDLERWGEFDVSEPFSFPFTSFSPETDNGASTINLGETYSTTFWSNSPKQRYERSVQ